MKTRTLSLLMAAMMLGTAPYVSAKPNEDGGSGGREDQYPHRAPGNHSATIQVVLNESNYLTALFFLEDPEVCISIYKNGTLVAIDPRSVEPSDSVTFNLSTYGPGQYEVIITCSEADDDYLQQLR